MKRTVDDFWQWFNENSEQLMDIDSLSDEKSENLLQKFDNVLKTYSEGIDFELGDLTTNGRSLLFTANGNEEYFDDVFNLCDSAPILDFWEIIALRQAQGEHASISYGKYHYKSKNLLFVPLENENNNEEVGLKVAITNYNENDDDQLIAVYSLIEIMIGEEICATMVKYLELCDKSSSEFDSENFLPLTDLPAFIEWKMCKQ
ncbi:MAG: hypothetical protein LBR28_04140 [Bacteroidales bacterium]|jgi:hypothetical protein|nr:hypothetical protein [Bacteroidales bacterium]